MRGNNTSSSYFEGNQPLDMGISINSGCYLKGYQPLNTKISRKQETNESDDFQYYIRISKKYLKDKNRVIRDIANQLSVALIHYLSGIQTNNIDIILTLIMSYFKSIGNYRFGIETFYKKSSLLEFIGKNNRMNSIEYYEDLHRHFEKAKRFLKALPDKATGFSYAEDNVYFTAYFISINLIGGKHKFDYNYLKEVAANKKPENYVSNLYRMKVILDEFKK